jgi:hypothetical protein
MILKELKTIDKNDNKNLLTDIFYKNENTIKKKAGKYMLSEVVIRNQFDKLLDYTNFDLNFNFVKMKIY